MPSFQRFPIKFYHFLPFPKKNTRDEDARENFGISDKKDKDFGCFFFQNLLDFGRRYLAAVPTGAAGAKNWEFWPSRSQNSRKIQPAADEASEF